VGPDRALGDPVRNELGSIDHAVLPLEQVQQFGAVSHTSPERHESGNAEAEVFSCPDPAEICRFGA